MSDKPTLDLIPREDLLIETVPTRPKGGQHVGPDRGGVRVTHIPSGMVAVSMTERSQHLNREVAMDMILAGLTHPRGRAI